MGHEFVSVNKSILCTELVGKLKERAHSEGTVRYNFHEELGSDLHVMLLCALKSRGRIHYHPKRDELVLCKEGRIKVVLYNESGDTDDVILDANNFSNFLMIKANQKHRIDILTDVALYLESTVGPYEKCGTIYNEV